MKFSYLLFAILLIWGGLTPASAQWLFSLPKNFAGFHQDTITVSYGQTYAYTVDTKQNEGLINTGVDAKGFMQQLMERDNRSHFKLTDSNHLRLDWETGAVSHYYLQWKEKALTGTLVVPTNTLRANALTDLQFSFTAGQRTPNATVIFEIPASLPFNPDSIQVNILGRGVMLLSQLATTSSGRSGKGYPYPYIGKGSVVKREKITQIILQHLDLRAQNGVDVALFIPGVHTPEAHKIVEISAWYTTTEPKVLESGLAKNILLFESDRIMLKRIPLQMERYENNESTYTTATFEWNYPDNVTLQQSTDHGITWSAAKASINGKRAVVKNLKPNKYYTFRLQYANKTSNTESIYTGMLDVKQYRASGKEQEDQTDSINAAILTLHKMGGGTLRFPPGAYSVRTIHLQSNVYLYLEKGAVIKALKGGDAPETTWFSDRAYRSGLSPTDKGPYEDPENYLTKQDVGHHYFHNAMFFGERLDNVKIIGNGTISGNGNLVTSDKVMNNAANNRCDKMFSLKLCTNVEIGGVYNPQDLWYDETQDAPYYIGEKGEKHFDTDNMLHIDQGGHFVLLATGTDSIYVHDTYFGKDHQGSARDIYDFMGCNHVTVTNIFSRVSSDDIVKPGSDCSLGFTRPSKGFRVRNIIGDTNCNLFQIGSETADDISDICVDNIYVLGANKAGFSISTNDGADIHDIHLNCGHTGPLHHRSKMLRTAAPFFISVSNRARILGATAEKFQFTENGRAHDELLITNVNIGKVERITINGIDISEIYGGSSFNGSRWKSYDGSQRRFSAIVAGYSLPDNIGFTLPDGRSTGYINDISFTDVHFLGKGGNPLSDTAQVPVELGVGQYNAADLKIQPAYGLWARHVQQLKIDSCSFRFEQPDHRYAIFLDDVQQVKMMNIKMMKVPALQNGISSRNTTGVQLSNIATF
ncbi:polygalacturonase [Chitinophaga dinghuensis]|uniref:Polygalacturonase n=1 Tax=Chitinophaga dinghuensis TaxID=1539050 RepID=A0A327WCU3_9BACT|nr:endopygalactorunase [Chitinophaga dinghuensis]RAJ87968.1 polygalacturonase [Chitinophaga dinghuensis]